MPTKRKPPPGTPPAPPLPPGRPTLLNPELRDRIVEAVKKLGFLSVSARVCGISARTMGYWMERGDHTGEQQKLEDPTGIYTDFRWRVMVAQAEREQGLLLGTRAEWALERMHPREYGPPPQRLEHDDAAQVDERLRKMSAAELQREIDAAEAGR